jgi:ATP-dependent DNA helicase RecG
LSRAALEDYLQRADQSVATPTEIVLENLRLQRTDGKLCNAAALLFAEGTKLPIGSQMQCGLFQDDVGVHFLDEQTIEAPVLTQLRQALAFVARNTRKAIRITGRPEREEVSEYPEEAVREAVVNAIIHRDYTSSGHVQVRIYHDRLEVWNPASLPYDVTIESLYGMHPSRPRNRKLAEAFHRAGLIEQWGTGTLRILRACFDRGLPRPEFRYDMGTFMAVLRSAAPVPGPALASAPSGLNNRQRRAIDHVRAHGSISPAEYREMVGASDRQARRDLSELVELGQLQRTGRTTSVRYTLPLRAE